MFDTAVHGQTTALSFQETVPASMLPIAGTSTVPPDYFNALK